MTTKSIIFKSKISANKFNTECRKSGILTQTNNKEVIVYVNGRDNVDRLSDKILEEIGENYLIFTE